MELLSRLLLLAWITTGSTFGFSLKPSPALHRSRLVAGLPHCESIRGGSNADLSTRGVSSSALRFAVTTAGGGDQDGSPSGEWTKKRLHNSALFRSGAILLSLVVALKIIPQAVQTQLPLQVSAVVHLLSFSTWFGTMFYTTFIAGFTMFKNLPRQVFGKLQAKLFPKYFQLSSIAVVLQMLTIPSALLTRPSASVAALWGSLVFTLANQWVIEPVSTQIMLERHDLENSGQTDTERYSELKKSFGKFHGLSSLTNLLALCAAVVHGVALGGLLVAAP